MKSMCVLQRGLRFFGFACMAGSMLLFVPDCLEACGVCSGPNECPSSPGNNRCGGALCENCSAGSTCRCVPAYDNPNVCSCTL